MQTFEFRGTLIFAHADLNIFHAKILRIQPEFGKINLFLRFFLCKFQFLRSYLTKRIISFFGFFLRILRNQILLYK